MGMLYTRRNEENEENEEGTDKRELIYWSVCGEQVAPLRLSRYNELCTIDCALEIEAA